MNDTTTRALVPKPQVSAGGAIAPIVPQNLDEAWRLSQAFAESGMTPKGIDSPAKVMMVICGGAEVGFGPFQSLQAFAVINGRLCMWGDAIPALLWSHGFKIKEWVENESDDYPDNMTAFCEVTRPDGDVIMRSFSVAKAKRAKLWNKRGRDGQDTPWVTNPDRMLQMRARGFCARDGAPDVLRGIAIREEVEDIEIVPEVTAATNRPQALSVDRIEPEEPTHEADLDEVLDGDELPPDVNDAIEEPQDVPDEPEDPEVADEPEEPVSEATEAPDDGEDFPPDMRKFIDSVENATTFGEVKGALQTFFTTSTFREMNLNQQNHIRRQTWETITEKKAEGHMIDLPDHAQDVSAFRLWLEAQHDPDAIRGTFDVLQRTPNYDAKDDTFKAGFSAAVQKRLEVVR